jgi:hypothetical protein
MSKEKILVSMVDSFMSYWGRAKDKKNVLCFICDSYNEAVTVAKNAKKRGDMKYINIDVSSVHGMSKKAILKEFQCNHFDLEFKKILLQIKTKKIYPSWYKDGYFLAGDEK